MTTTVTSRGGNKYKVSIDGRAETVDLDGFTIMADDEYDKILAAEKEHGEVFLQDEMECPTSARESGVWNEHELAALDHVANYSGFDAEEYLASVSDEYVMSKTI